MSRDRRLLACLVLGGAAAGCSFDSSGTQHGNGDGSPPDAPISAIDAADLPDGRPCPTSLTFAPSNVAACDLTLTGALVLDLDGVYRLDTDTGILTDPAGDMVTLDGAVINQTDAPALFALAVPSLAIEGGTSLYVFGDRALVVLATGDIDITGALYVGGLGARNGPGGNHPVACADGVGADGEMQTDEGSGLSAGSGGGGGSYGGTGGEGAIADGADNANPSAPGMAGGATDLVPLRGGCRGGAGASDSGVEGTGGGGGGAGQLIAGGTMHILGVVSARGGGGRGTTGTEAGGGGGGAGGAILLEALDLDIEGAVTANGGGGGEGSRTLVGSSNGSNGHVGDDLPAAGGDGAGLGGAGGPGGSGSGSGDGDDGSTGFSSGVALAGGGGGGGGVGRIHLRVIDDQVLGESAVLSPQPE